VRRHFPQARGDNFDAHQRIYCAASISLPHRITTSDRGNGAGINYTLLSGVNLLNGAGRLEHDSFGFALQAGVDFKLDKNWSINLDVKKVQIRSDVFISGARASDVKVDPLLIGVGVGYRF
jgi:opacity protein-like surface antigen